MSQATPHQWNRSELDNPHQHPLKQQRVHAMFSAIAQSYDLLNHLLSFNMDQRWRRRAAQLAQLAPSQTALDLCCGTGDQTFALAQAQPQLKHIVAVDFCPEMLQIAQTKNKKTYQSSPRPNITWTCSDVLQLDLPPESFDCVTCAFGLRNLIDHQRFFDQNYHLLKPKGRIVVLEFAMPKNPIIKWAYQCYFRLALPVIGSIISSDRTGAYNYLPASVNSFNTQPTLEQAARKAGFKELSWHNLAAGAVLALVAVK
ncbi:MAG: bifunctional demethylmenaquinone methyltransferase/2-methoxy-6-polyprenyl-1,4-benzoquinol methylase UbiE [Sedimentisphaerales bacterium]|nr:bifunctional demethylmenaquinone methyltransferase/2-methoxy-6-polyprenyl-1,4-benzoquinol methylase UbiE [Sedimentisphaerales bacterium]